jgi:hypothetical protein
MKKSNKPVNYVSNKAMYAAVIDFQDKYAIDPNTEIPATVINCFFRLAENLSRKSNFARYSFKEDMVLDGIEECYKRIHSFKREKSDNAFSYFTQVIWNSFVRRINLEADEQFVKATMILDYQLQEQLTNNFYIPGQNETMVKAAEFVEKYNETKRKKKEKAAEKQATKGLDAIFTD